MSESRTLLVIDEEAYLLRTFVQLAESAGYRVEGSPDVRKGWDLAKRLRPDILLVNTIPPDGDGKHLCQQVKADPVLAHTAIMMLAGGSHGGITQPDLPGIDVDEYVLKPITSRDLLARVQAMLRVKHTEAQLVQIRKELKEKQSLLIKAQQQLRTSQTQPRQPLSTVRKHATPLPVNRTGLYETLPIGCCTVDKYGLILEANSLAAQQCGTQQSLFVETLFPDYVADNDVSTFFEHLAKVFDSKQRQSCELTLKTGNGHPRVVRIDAQIQPQSNQNNGACCTMTLTDITASAPKTSPDQQIEDLLRTQERLQATIETHYVSQETHTHRVKEVQRLQELLQSELDTTRCQFQAILDSVNDGVTLCDITGYFEIFNARMEELTGYSKEEANQHKDFQFVLYPDPKHYHQAIMRMAAITASGEPQSSITTIHTKEGRERTLAVYTSRVECGQQEWLLSTYQDITEYRRLKQKLIRSQKRRPKSVRL